ncbi:PTS lactose/cellobiose transporter subunit IIA [Proteiniclasticum sp. SCR006]|uniref:PTS lactose/cellobiose transporter subunit IIA n=1 Tax=Proteiniclasticum aestuarii TaxID=2817862 RepID=A0A939HC41_9CLOT|nr:PTS lactose/cellobiose transporter subunit IIA [Proteiniclasticum aestuarii]MBO1265222.1 PTS lactose/cellobiose transporter subunit IIA [Proteiniclasticum aestuarii]
MNNEMEMIIFNIINYAGTAKGLAYEALNEAEKGNFDKIPELMKEADQNLLEAHKVQTSIIQAEARGEKPEVSVLFVHAQDQLMTAMESKTLIESLIRMHKKIDGVK